MGRGLFGVGYKWDGGGVCMTGDILATWPRRDVLSRCGSWGDERTGSEGEETELGMWFHDIFHMLHLSPKPKIKASLPFPSPFPLHPSPPLPLPQHLTPPP